MATRPKSCHADVLENAMDLEKCPDVFFCAHVNQFLRRGSSLPLSTGAVNTENQVHLILHTLQEILADGESGRVGGCVARKQGECA
jgi:hypothetical protein